MTFTFIIFLSFRTLFAALHEVFGCGCTISNEVCDNIIPDHMFDGLGWIDRAIDGLNSMRMDWVQCANSFILYRCI
jgi:hypothetical protein